MYKKIIFNNPDFSTENKPIRCTPSESAISLMKLLLNKKKNERITVEEIFNTDYFIKYDFNQILDFEFSSPLKQYSIEYKDKINEIKIDPKSEYKKDFPENTSLSPINSEIRFEDFNIFN